ncbi:MAG: hydrogenase maturation protease [Acidobacteriia bacterium]|nr:hydrogenase maturation protease [Terriglobia bacterium]
MAAQVLIVAYGNPMRCDDGVAWRVADALAPKSSDSDVEILRLHQLTPELADTVRNFGTVIFVDAASCDDARHKPGMIRVEEIRSGTSEPARFSHVLSPTKILDLAWQLYNASPRALVVTVVGENFGHGDSLSPPVATALPELVARIERLIKASNP